MSAGPIQKRLRGTISWFKGHVRKTEDIEARCREILDASDSIGIDLRLKIGRTLTELKQRAEEAKTITLALQRYQDNAADTRDLIGELKNLIEETEGENE